MERKTIILILFVCYSIVAVIRLTAPFDIDDRDQAKQGLYVLDVIQGGSFFLPAQLGQPSTKPPFYTWAAAAFSLVLGGVTDFTIRLPAVVSGLGVVLVTYLIAELLFSAEVGLFAGLILILNYHFADLSSTARTDMMQCFFIASSLYLFLLAYRNHEKKSIYNASMFAAMGLGSITKSPVAFFLPALIILVFLVFMKDLKWLQSMQIRAGIIIWLLIMLSWFTPAMLTGGRKYFDVVVVDEMINRFFGIGTRAEKTRPFYYLVGHFFGKFLPWSLFVPSAIVRHWKFRKVGGGNGLLFIVVWFLTVIVFFSISRGKRADYILPLYPAASILVGEMWFSLFGRSDPNLWKGHLRVLSLGYFILNLFFSTSLVVLFAMPDVLQVMVRIAPKSSETIELLYLSISRQPELFLLITLALAAFSVLGSIILLRKSMKTIFFALLIVAALNLSFYFLLLSPKATSLGGQQKKEFCLRARKKIDLTGNLQFFNVESSLLFYMGKNVQPLNRDEVLHFFHTANRPYMITNEKDYLDLRREMDKEIVLLEESEHLIKDNTRYVLFGRKDLK